MSKACLILALLFSSNANAFLDSIVDTAKDSAEGAAVVGAVTELIGEVDEDSAPVEQNKEIQAANKEIQAEVAQAVYLDRETREILKGPDISSKRLSSNIRFTTAFLKRTKKLLKTIGLISPEVTTAVNTAETNMQQNEMLQNQQAMMLMQQQQVNEQKKKDLAERKSWEDFIATQRAARNKGQK